MNNTRSIELRERLLRDHMRINGEEITAVVNINGKSIIMTANRTYITLPKRRSLREWVVGGWNRFWLRLRRVYG